VSTTDITIHQAASRTVCC